LACVGQKAAVSALAFHPAGRHVASGAADGGLRIFNVEMFEPGNLREGARAKSDRGAACVASRAAAVGGGAHIARAVHSPRRAAPRPRASRASRACSGRPHICHAVSSVNTAVAVGAGAAAVEHLVWSRSGVLVVACAYGRCTAFRATDT
jgi:WD40 repeat protein